MRADVLGVSVAYEVAGEGRPVVLLHGTGVDHRLMSVAFEPVFANGAGWQRFYPDLPGMGGTPGPDWITSEDGMLDVVEAFVDAVAPGGGAALVGSSYGGYLSLGLVHRRARDLAGVALIAPATRVAGGPARPGHHVFERDDEVVASVREDESRWLDISVAQTAPNLEFFRAAVMPGAALADEAFLERLAAGSNLPYDVRVLGAPFEGPSLIVAGRQDNVVGWADKIPLLESFPRATFAMLDRAGHALVGERRLLVRSLLDDWLDRLEADG